MEKEVRVRFAPSPTGPLHIGGLRTALFNYLFAKNQGGKMLLRIEDTDRTRFVAGAEDYIKEALEWSGIIPDESPWKSGSVGPYRQSERKEIYQKYIRQLIENEKAYYAFDTAEELEKMREELKAAKVDSPQYNSITRLKMSNSLTLSGEEVQARINNGDPFVVRLKVPEKAAISVDDMVRGTVTVHSHTIDDKILLKSDGMPTYHMASVVDDHLMGISHVIRGEEWLPSAPFHVMLYKSLGWEESMPKFAHLPLLLKPSGKGKLSKRDGDKLGFSVFPLEWKDPNSGEISSGFREDGFLADAFTNFIALLGWNPGTEQELFSMDELIQAFSAERILKAGTKFDIEKAKWFNQQYIKKSAQSDLVEYLKEALAKEEIECTDEKAVLIVEAMRERITFPHELWENAKFFFEAPSVYDQKVAKKKWSNEAVKVFSAYKEAVLASNEFNRDTAKEILNEVLEAQGIGMGKVMQALRLSITGLGGGPDLMLIMEVLGKEEVAKRIEKAIADLETYLG